MLVRSLRTFASTILLFAREIVFLVAVADRTRALFMRFAVSRSHDFVLIILRTPFEKYRRHIRIVVQAPSVRQWPVDGVEVLAVAPKAPQHIGFGQEVSILLGTRGDALQSETR